MSKKEQAGSLSKDKMYALLALLVSTVILIIAFITTEPKNPFNEEGIYTGIPKMSPSIVLVMLGVIAAAVGLTFLFSEKVEEVETLETADTSNKQSGPRGKK